MVIFPRGAGAPRITALLALILLLPLSAASDPALSQDDVTLLKRGTILFRTELPPGPREGEGMGGTAVAFLRADTEAVWQVLLDFPGHARLFPRVRESAVMESRADQTVVGYRIAVGFLSFRFFVKNYADASSHTLRWELDQSRENDLFKEHWGYWRVEPWGEGALVTYAMGGRTTLPAFLTRGAGRDGTILTVKALRDWVEQRQAL